MTELCLIAAVEKSGGIGKQGQIPWHLPEDLKRFKRLTSGYPTIMGRLTYESIGRALPDRPAIVVTRTLESLPDARACKSFEKAQEYAQALGHERVFVIGGAAAYCHFLSKADFVYLTHVDLDVAGCDAFFPDVSGHELTHPEFTLSQAEYHATDEGMIYSFKNYRRKATR